MILSWDIGIKNMAYCLMNKTSDIKSWGIINLYDDVPKLDYACQASKKNNQVCGKKANFVFKNKYFCNVHNKNGSLLTFKCSHENCKNKVSYYDTEKKLYCTKHSKGITDPFKIDGKKNLNQLTKILYAELDKIPEFSEAKTILIENQPVLKNPTMKSIQMILYSYFMLRYVVDKKLDIEIKLMSAKNKLKVYDGPPINKYDNLKSKYSRDKKLSIDYCQYYLEKKKNNYWIDYFKNYKKNKGKGVIGNDDLADTYLMIIYYINNNNLNLKK